MWTTRSSRTRHHVLQGDGIREGVCSAGRAGDSLLPHPRQGHSVLGHTDLMPSLPTPHSSVVGSGLRLSSSG